MKKLSLITISAITATALIFSCKKDRIETPEPEQLTAYQPINTYLDSKKQQEQDFLITGQSNDTIIGNQGTKIYGAKNCLRDGNNDTVAYPFNIKLVELYTPKDMIYWQMPTMSSGNALNSDGEIRVRAVKNNVELTLAASCPFGVEMPNGSPSSTMNIYNGNDNGTFVDWVNSSVLFSTTSYGYQGFINSLGWISCAEQVATGGHTVSFTSTTDDLTNVGIFIYIPATKTLIQGYNQTASGVPSGSSVKIVLMAQDSNGDLFSYTKTRTINGNTSIDLSLSSTTDAALTSHLNGL
ncbi:MAG: hypothetical protein P1U41_05580 [Vicingaceae bacterium]|nr:hypothetical protein [Vicingaceae bacterium]